MAQQDAHDYNLGHIARGAVPRDVLARALTAFALEFQQRTPGLIADGMWGPKTEAAWLAETRGASRPGGSPADASPPKVGSLDLFPVGHDAIIARYGATLKVVDDPARPGWLQDDEAWRKANIRSVRWHDHWLHMHTDVVDRVAAALEEAYRASGYMPKCIGTLAMRRILGSPTRALSTHAVGAALDIDAAENGYGVPLHRTSLGQNIAFGETLERHGLTWGVRWRTPDAMHFQCGSPS